MANKTYNIYCDESCHLEHDHKKFMFLGIHWIKHHIEERKTNDMLVFSTVNKCKGRIASWLDVLRFPSFE